MTQTVSTPFPATAPAPGTIDPVHSEVSFSVRHMMVSKVRGHFTEFEGTIVTADTPPTRASPPRST